MKYGYENFSKMFFIIKGSYRKVEPFFINSNTDRKNYVGGYNPYNDDTKEWYGLYDKENFLCYSACSDLEVVLGVLKRLFIKEWVGDKTKFFRKMKKVIKEPNKIHRELLENVFEEYGDFFNDIIEETLKNAMKEKEERKPINIARKKIRKKVFVEIENAKKTGEEFKSKLSIKIKDKGRRKKNIFKPKKRLLTI